MSDFRSTAVAAPSPGGRLLLTKTDGMGDKLFGLALVRGLREHLAPALTIWLLRAGMESLASLLPGSTVFRPQTQNAAGGEALRVPPASGTGPWAGLVIVPVDVNPNGGLDPANHPNLPWWLEFTRALEVDVAVAGTLDLNWLDQALVAASQAPCRLGPAATSGWRRLDWFTWRQLGLREDLRKFTHSIPHAEQDAELASMEKLLQALPGAENRRLRFVFTKEEVGEATAGGAVEESPAPIVFAPGGSGTELTWPPEQYAALALTLLAAGHGPIKIMAGPADEATLRQLLAALPLGEHTSGLAVVSAHATDLRATARLLAGARLLVAGDSFPRHLAGALGTPYICIMSGGHPRRFLAPGTRGIIIVQPLACMPCQRSCCLDRARCVKDVPLQPVLDAVHEALAHPPANLVWRPIPIQSPQEEVLAAMHARDTRNHRMLAEKEAEITALWLTCQERLQAIHQGQKDLAEMKERYLAEKQRVKTRVLEQA